MGRLHGGVLWVSLLVSATLAGTLIAGQGLIQNPATPTNPKAGRILKLEEAVRLSDEGGKFFFRYPKTVKTAPDGSMFVLEPDQILQFDARGGFVHDFYRKGQGPGEVNYVSGFDFAPGRLIVHSNSPDKIVWYDFQGKVLRDISLAKAGSRFEFVFYDRGTYWLRKDVFPPPTGKAEGIDVRQILVALSEDGGSVEETVSFINKGFRAGGAYVFQGSHALPFGGRYIFFSNSREYAVHLFDTRSRQTVRTFMRKYRRVKPPAGHRESAIISPDGTRYETPGAEYLEDVNGLYEYKGMLWVTTSTKDTDKGILVDVFNLEGKYIDAFWLKLNGSLIAVSKDMIFVREKASDETIRIVGYKVIEPEFP